MNSKISGEVLELRQQIIDYLSMNPMAADTIEGVKIWWINSKPTSLENIQEALAILEREGAIERTESQAGGAIYSKGHQN